MNNEIENVKFTEIFAPEIDFEEEEGTGRIQPEKMVEHVNEQIEYTRAEIMTTENEFPLNVLPLPLQAIVKDTHENLGFPVDFIAGGILFAASGAIGNTYGVEVKRDYVESASIFIVLVGPVGSNKSHPMKYGIKPISDEDQISYSQYENDKETHKRNMELSKKEREEEGIQDPKQPIWKQHIVSDATLEALFEIHHHNRRGVIYYVDEIIGLFKNFNRYNKGSDQETFLSLFNNNPINISRKSSDPIFLTKTFISIGGTIQNGVLVQLAKNNRLENGLISRILFVKPNGVKKMPWSKSSPKEQTYESYKAIILRLLSLPCRYDETLTPTPRILRFTPEAKESLYSWQRDNATKVNTAETETIAGIFSKLDIYVSRLALILHLLTWSSGEDNGQPIDQIGVTATEGAIKLVEYFRECALQVNSIISNDNPLDKLTVDKRQLYEALPTKFTTGEGLVIAIQLGIPEDTYQKWLKREVGNLFKKPKKGEYEKIV